MTTPTTPEQAKYIASHLLTHDATASLALRSLADQVESLTKERDEFNYSLVSTANRKLRSEVDVLRKERDALKDAARLALDVCIEMRRYGNQRSVAMAIGAEAALKAAL